MLTVAACFLLVGVAYPGMAQREVTETWVGSWATAPYGNTNQQQTPDFANVTLRQIVHVTLGGDALRIRFTNEFGTEPLTIGFAHVAVSAGRGAIQRETDRGVTFGGNVSVTIPPGAMALSDSVALRTAALTDLDISIYLPAQQISVASFHGGANQTNYLEKGNVVDAEKLEAPVEVKSWYFLKGIDVRSGTERAAAIVTFGDSITDGACATPNENSRWPDVLARRLGANQKTQNLAVLNLGIGGNRVLRDGAGPSALARFDRDVLAQSAVKYIIVLEGINDIGRLARNNDPVDLVRAEDLELGLEQMVARAHEQKIKIFGATVTPYRGAGYYSEKGEAVRKALNLWIRTSGEFDGVVDFDKAVQDPQNPQMLLPQYDCRDHLHPSDSGYKAMGDAIDLNLFQ